MKQGRINFMVVDNGGRKSVIIADTPEKLGAAFKALGLDMMKDIITAGRYDGGKFLKKIERTHPERLKSYNIAWRIKNQLLAERIKERRAQSALGQFGRFKKFFQSRPIVAKTSLAFG